VRRSAEATQAVIDRLKTEAPFWRKEATPEGSRWLDAREHDGRAAQRWHKEPAWYRFRYDMYFRERTKPRHLVKDAGRRRLLLHDLAAADRVTHPQAYVFISFISREGT
jgi:hypothetical protein